MIGKLFKMIFLPKEARAKLETHTRVQNVFKEAETGPGGQQRTQVLKDAMSVYRQQTRDVYDKLDEKTRRQIEEDAAKTFGDALKPRN